MSYAEDRSTRALSFCTTNAGSIAPTNFEIRGHGFILRTVRVSWDRSGIHRRKTEMYALGVETHAKRDAANDVYVAVQSTRERAAEPLSR